MWKALARMWRYRWVLIALLVVSRPTVASAYDDFSFWIETDKPVYFSGVRAYVTVHCENRTDRDIVIVGRFVLGIGYVFGTDGLRRWGDTRPDFQFGPYADFGYDWIKYPPYVVDRGGERLIKIPPRSKVVFATLATGEIGWPTNTISTGQPLPGGAYVIRVMLSEVRTSVGTFRDV